MNFDIKFALYEVRMKLCSFEILQKCRIFRVQPVENQKFHHWTVATGRAKKHDQTLTTKITDSKTQQNTSKTTSKPHPKHGQTLTNQKLIPQDKIQTSYS